MCLAFNSEYITDNYFIVLTPINRSYFIFKLNGMREHMKNWDRLRGRRAWNFGGRNLSNLRYVDDTILLAESSNDLKELLMKVKEDSDKTGLHFHLMTRKEILNCDIDNKDIDIVTDCFLLQFSHQFKCRLQQRHQEKGEAPKGRSGRISNDHQGQKHVIRDQSYTLIVPLTMNRCKSWKMKKVIKKEKWFIWNTVLEGSSIDTLDLQKDEQMVPEQIKPDTSLRQKWWNGSCPRWGTSWVGRVLWKKQ